jgi:WD40 repeat protein
MHPSNLHRVAHWPAQDILFCLAVADDAKRLWFGSSDASVYAMNLNTEKPEREKLVGEGHSSYVTSMARCGDYLVTGSYDRKLIWWNLTTGQQKRWIPAHDKWIRRVIATPDQTRVISVADDMQCRVWDVESGSLVAEFSDHRNQTPHHYPSMLYAVAVSPDGTKLATGDRVGHVAIWETGKFEKIAQLETPVMYTWDPKQRRHSIGGIRSLAFSGDGQRLAVGGIGKIGNIDHLGGPARLEVFDWQSGQRQLELEDNKLKGLIEQIHWGPDDQWILTSGGDHKGFTTIYNAGSGELMHQNEHPGHIHGLWHHHSYTDIFIASHKELSHWSMEDNET